jgi:hypothetical protein
MKRILILAITLILASSCRTALNSHVGIVTGDPIAWAQKFKIEDARAASATAMQHDPPDPFAAQCYDTIAESLIAFGQLNATPPAGVLDAFERLRLLNRSIAAGGLAEKLKVKCAWMIGPGGLH